MDACLYRCAWPNDRACVGASTMTVLGARRSAASRHAVSLPVVRPNAFAAALGILGLASVWRAMAELYGWPGGVADAICLLAALISGVLGFLVLARLARAPGSVAQEELSDPVQAPFTVIPFIVLMLLGTTGLAPHAKSAANVLFFIGLIGSLLLGGRIVGGWLAGPIDERCAHPAYYLAVLGPGLIGSLGAATLGHRDLAWMCLGLGLIGWLIVASVISNRLTFGPALPPSLAATRAIEIAPPAVASTAYLGLNGDRVDPFVLGLAGFCVLMLLAQLHLLPIYRKLPLFPNYWAFGFPLAAVTALAVRWLALEHPAGERLYAAILIAAITAFIGAIALGSVIALARHLRTANSGNSRSVGVTITGK